MLEFPPFSKAHFLWWSHTPPNQLRVILWSFKMTQNSPGERQCIGHHPAVHHNVCFKKKRSGLKPINVQQTSLYCIPHGNTETGDCHLTPCDCKIIQQDHALYVIQPHTSAFLQTFLNNSGI